jgi:hypothetical protein
MAQEKVTEVDSSILVRFPLNGEDGLLESDQKNPAILLYGRRFYKDQTPVEYLAEFLLAFTSPKNENGEGEYQFRLLLENGAEPQYWPENRVALKLFSFFSISKLETRHEIHRRAYLDALDTLTKQISGTSTERDETIRLIQSLFCGFVGVAKNRTWVTYSFLPASTSLLANEVGWEHPRALKNNHQISNWESSKPFFGRFRNFMARGGELLFLQLANLFSNSKKYCENELLLKAEYSHLKPRVLELHSRVEVGLSSMLQESIGQIGGLVTFIEGSLKNYAIDFKPKSTKLGWVPEVTRTEALLFAIEIDNICLSNISALDKLELLQTLCSMQVLRSLCFQARRADATEKKSKKFAGNYVWIVADSESKLNSPMRQMAQTSFNKIEALLYRSVRAPILRKNGNPVEPKDIKNGDDNTFRLFKKFSKELSLVIPRTGTGQRFSLNQKLLRFLVAVLIKPGERIRLTHFYERVFAHYGIALGGEQLTVALNWIGSETGGESYAVSSSTAWVEDALQQGGFLVELSDAVSMVKNPA